MYVSERGFGRKRIASGLYLYNGAGGGLGVVMGEVEGGGGKSRS